MFGLNLNNIGANMEKDAKKLIRSKFREAVFRRDGYKCRVCKKPGKDRQTDHSPHKSPIVNLDAHHICDRHIMPNGGYVLENGISLCDDCHMKAESHWAHGATPEPNFAPEDLYKIIYSSYEAACKAAEK